MLSPPRRMKDLFQLAEDKLREESGPARIAKCLFPTA
jgi:hypothetical protein